MIQGNNETFADFVDRLIQTVARVFGDLEQAMPLIKELAYEQANRWCIKAIQPWKNKDLRTYIMVCRDINDAVITGQVIAAALHGPNQGQSRAKGEGFSRWRPRGWLHFMLLQDSGFKRGDIEMLGTNSKQPGDSHPLGRHPGWDGGPGTQETL